MTYRSLAAAPLVFGALTLALVLGAPAAVRDAVVQGEVDASKVLALVGLTAAALAFGRGDYLRGAWGLLAVSYVFFLGRDAMLLVKAPTLVFDGVRAALVLVGNTCLVIGTWKLARAWANAGLEHPGSKGARWTFIGAALLVSLALAGPILLVDARDLALGLRTDFEMIPSDLADILSLPLIAPVALTALAVREGTLRWPWMLLTSSLVAGLLYDTIYILPNYVSVLPAASFRFYSEQFHVLAGVLACAAGLAQRKAVTEDDEEGAADDPSGR